MTEENGCVIKNPMFHMPNGSEETPMDSLRQLQDMFRGRMEDDVVHMLFTESGFDFEKTLNQLLCMASDTNDLNSPPPYESIDKLEEVVEFPLPSSSSSVQLPPTLPTKKPCYSKAASEPPRPPPLPHRTVRSPQPKTFKSFETKADKLQKATGIRTDIREAIESEVQVFIILRGVPGSGKSYLANLIAERTGGKIFSADNYHIKNGKYVFNGNDLPLAHEWNLREAKKACDEGISPIIIDNTNSEAWEMKPYAVYAYKSGYRIFLAEPETSWKYSARECAKRNTHGVSQTVIERMLDRFDIMVRATDLIKGVKKPKKVESETVIASRSFNSIAAPLLQTAATETPSKSNIKRERLASLEPLQLSDFMILNSAKSDSDSANQSDEEAPDVAWEKDEEFIYKCSETDVVTKETCQEVIGIHSSVAESKPVRPPRRESLEIKPQNNSDALSERQCQTERGIINNNSLEKRSSMCGRDSIAGSSNWAMPEYPSGPPKEQTKQINEKVYVKNSSSQTEGVDWALLEVKQTDQNEFSDIHAHHEEGGASDDEVSERSNIVYSSVKLDKGTHVPDFPGALTREEIIVNFKLQFPKAQEVHLGEVLDACHGNMTWAQNLLDEFDDEHFAEYEASVRENLREASPPAEHEEGIFSLSLSPEFAAQLEGAFGQVNGSSTSGGAEVKISHGVARLIHHFWKLSSSNEQNDKISLVDQISLLASVVADTSAPVKVDQMNESVSKALDRPQSELAEIMDVELALRLSRQERDNAVPDSHNQNLIATKLKREQLYRTYPGVAEEELELVFNRNNFSLTHTLAELEERYGPCNLLTLKHRIWLSRASAKPKSSDLPALIEDSKASGMSSESYSEMRRRIQNMEKAKYDYLAKARLCFQCKQYAVASYYRDEARIAQEKIDKISRSLVHSHQKYHNKSNEIDLHGFRMSEVHTVLKAFVEYKQEELNRSNGRKIVLDIVTGWGSHGTAPKIKPAVINYFENKKIRYEVPNAGCVRVFLTQ
ncbi:NEDD4-binding protein 2-like 2 [Halotydeus destructor]|nr:NEDD4-binding protein 2-like 2 [Halotydeus destructor]